MTQGGCPPVHSRPSGTGRCVRVGLSTEDGGSRRRSRSSLVERAAEWPGGCYCEVPERGMGGWHGRPGLRRDALLMSGMGPSPNGRTERWGRSGQVGVRGLKDPGHVSVCIVHLTRSRRARLGVPGVRLGSGRRCKSPRPCACCLWQTRSGAREQPKPNWAILNNHQSASLDLSTTH